MRSFLRVLNACRFAAPCKYRYMRFSWFASIGLVLVPSTLVFAAASCGSDHDTGPGDGDSSADGTGGEGGPNLDAGPDNFIRDGSFDVNLPPPDEYCGMPGSIVFEQDTHVIVPGGPTGDGTDVTFLTLPNGYCAHYFATIPSARAIRFAPGGELFVASPSRSTAGGAPTGRGEIDILPDDNKDGVADSQLAFLGSLSSTEGMLFAPGFLYYQDDTKVMKLPYTTGTRVNTSTATQVIDVNVYISPFHWPKTIDMADDGRIYVTNGGDQTETCVAPHPFRGGVLEIDGTPNGKQVAQGFRNSQYLRCQKGHNLCFVNELTRDFSATQGGREKLVHFKDGDDFGFPCCATKDTPFPDIMPVPDCSMVQPDEETFRVGDTPFGLDFEPDSWKDTWNKNAFIAEHGAVGTWIGARVVAVKTDPTTGKPLPGTTTGSGDPQGSMRTFASGWDDDTRSHGRPADLTFSADGRLFIANDWNGQIFWIAPLGVKIVK